MPEDDDLLFAPEEEDGTRTPFSTASALAASALASSVLAGSVRGASALPTPLPGPLYAAAPGETWKVLIADDEDGVHQVTRMVLAGFTYLGRGLTFLSAHSGAETLRLMAENPDTAVILLDVVMEEADSGLRVARLIREEQGNRFTRIILRTGQPGQAPERRVILEYDINDYREKTEITAQKLFTAMVSALRTHADMLTIEANRRGLEKIIEAGADIFRLDSLEKFISGVLTQLTSLLGLKDVLYCQVPGPDPAAFVVRAATGRYAPFIGRAVADLPEEDLRLNVDEAARAGRGGFCRNRSHVEYMRGRSGSPGVICFEEVRPLTPLDRKLVDIFFANVAIAFDNIHLNMEAEAKAEAALVAQHQAEAAGREVVVQIARRVESLRKLSSAVAHQLRNPMTIIAGFANLLRRKPEMQAAHLEYLDGIVDAAARIEKLTTVVNGYNLIRLGETMPVYLPFFLAGLHGQAVERARVRGLAVEWTVEAEPVRVRLDPGLMEKALLALVDNALDATENGRGTVRLGARTGGGLVHLEVWDGGRGIPETELAYVLDPFYSTKPQGVGMGLPLAERIAQEHGGRLAIVSAPGRGTTAVVSVPMEERAHTPVQAGT